MIASVFVSGVSATAHERTNLWSAWKMPQSTVYAMANLCQSI